MQNLTAQTLAGVAWIEGGAVHQIPASRTGEFGVRRADGAWLSFDGVSPYCPLGGRRAAVEVASTIVVDDTVQWVRAI
ncbi:hypothetical protein I5G97_gp028 [Mycobacterium phage Curiosium]|uniref:Uncharacterized protein n=1 Tax=Mycobacterium phage Curiosium TaxID=2599859 RepID=A0A5J6TTH0_9CAUD|nr:hypothetical protein I5G97_gp028 [Mycobacterium phage Curiosium]QFG14125.1 hypothetical protein PBI_CURIOSIUM_82 [Mycobacterium phage Curiosium]